MLWYIQWLPEGIRKKAAAFAKSLPGHPKGRGYLMRGALPLRQRYIGNAYVFRRNEKEKLLKHSRGAEPAELLRRVYDSIGYLKDSDQMQSIDLTYWLPGDILKKTDRMSMAHSL